ncbi:MAG TPA: protein-disulfide reductase DsbD domain-containing protein [Chryseosolibacter sp.]
MAKIPTVVPLMMAICFAPLFLGGRQAAPVSWSFEARPGRGGEATLLFTATLAPGWHLYSQHLAEGGPLPTRFRLEPADAFICETPVGEKGAAHTYYDSLYGMDVTWYAGAVSFGQKIRLIKPVPAIRGTVEYMTCNDRICIPCEEQFTIELTP